MKCFFGHKFKPILLQEMRDADLCRYLIKTSKCLRCGKRKHETTYNTTAQELRDNPGVMIHRI